uniref:ORF132 n=1 Tax=Malaco herpesvirus 1 TaxID=3031797 RepID=A0AA48P7V8_9VIRU|nr:TPA_asm: ORF132 [Malaco herpesvirus 1]
MATTTRFVSRYSGAHIEFTSPTGKFLWIYDSGREINFNALPRKVLVLNETTQMNEVLKRLRVEMKNVVLCNITPYGMFAKKSRRQNRYYCFRDIEEKIDAKFVCLDAHTKALVENEMAHPKDKSLTDMIADLHDYLTDEVHCKLPTPYETVIDLMRGNGNVNMKPLYRSEIIYESAVRTREIFKEIFLHPQMTPQRRETFVNWITRLLSSTPPEQMVPFIDTDFVSFKDVVYAVFDQKKPINDREVIFNRLDRIMNC